MSHQSISFAQIFFSFNLRSFSRKSGINEDLNLISFSSKNNIFRISTSYLFSSGLVVFPHIVQIVRIVHIVLIVFISYRSYRSYRFISFSVPKKKTLSPENFKTLWRFEVVIASRIQLSSQFQFGETLVLLSMGCCLLSAVQVIQTRLHLYFQCRVSALHSVLSVDRKTQLCFLAIYNEALDYSCSKQNYPRSVILHSKTHMDRFVVVTVLNFWKPVRCKLVAQLIVLVKQNAIFVAKTAAASGD